MTGIIAMNEPLQQAVERSTPASTIAAAALERFRAQGLPHKRLEGWRWSDVHAALRDWRPANDVTAAQTIPPSAFDGVKPLEFRIVDGRIQLPEEQVDGVDFGVMPAAATIVDMENEGLISLNVAMTKKALGLAVKDGADVARPILIRHIASAGAPIFAQTLTRIGAGASATIIESFEVSGAAFYTHLNHMDVRSGASLTRHTLQAAAPEAVVYSKCAAKVEREASFNQAALLFGAKLARLETLLHYLGDGTKVSLNSASLVRDRLHADVTTNIVHLAPSCETRQKHKSVIADAARAVFQGKFNVAREGQKTDADMQANALLLSDRGEANHKPELEIYADDVACAHGSTVGALDDNALFYMRQRGLDEKAARALLIEAFVGEVFDEIAHKGVEQALRGAVGEWLGALS